MSVSKIIYELVQILSEDKANLVLMFAQFLQLQGDPVTSTAMAEPQAGSESWSDLVAELEGSWPDFPSLEELRQC